MLLDRLELTPYINDGNKVRKNSAVIKAGLLIFKNKTELIKPNKSMKIPMMG